MHHDSCKSTTPCFHSVKHDGEKNAGCRSFAARQRCINESGPEKKKRFNNLGASMGCNPRADDLFKCDDLVYDASNPSLCQPNMMRKQG